MTLETEVERPEYIDPRFREWRRPLGELGNFADRLLAILSHASVAGVPEIRDSDLYESFAQLEQEFPHLVPRLLMRQQPSFYSRRLGETIGELVWLGELEISASTFRDYEIASENAEQNLTRLRESVGDDFVDDLQPVGVRLAEFVKEKQTS